MFNVLKSLSCEKKISEKEREKKFENEFKEQRTQPVVIDANNRRMNAKKKKK